MSAPPPCPFSDCPGRQRRLPTLTIAHSRLKTRNGWRRRRLCKHCRRSFTPGTGTIYHRLRSPKAEFDRAVQMQTEGMSKAAIARVLGRSPSTIGRWLERAGRHASTFHDAHVRVDQAQEFQLDELNCHAGGAAREPWAFSGIEVWSRLWTSLHVGRRTLRSTVVFVRQVAKVIGMRTFPPLVGSDGFKYYERALRSVYSFTTFLYQQVENRYTRERILRSTARLVFGSEAAWVAARERCEDSKRPNTAFIERLNLRKRQCCSFLRRRNPAPARSPRKIDEALQLVRLLYNYILPHSSLQFGRERRTPAMQAGIFCRPLTLREIFMWIPPPKPIGRQVLEPRLARAAAR